MEREAEQQRTFGHGSFVDSTAGEIALLGGGGRNTKHFRVPCKSPEQSFFLLLLLLLLFFLLLLFRGWLAFQLIFACVCLVSASEPPSQLGSFLGPQRRYRWLRDGPLRCFQSSDLGPLPAGDTTRCLKRGGMVYFPTIFFVLALSNLSSNLPSLLCTISPRVKKSRTKIRVKWPKPEQRLPGTRGSSS